MPVTKRFSKAQPLTQPLNPIGESGSDLLNRLAIQPRVCVLVFSDSHGQDEWMIRLAGLYPEADLILHLGDHCDALSDLATRLGKPLLGVAGNCDGWIGRHLPNHLLLTLAGRRLFLTHGHLYGVKQKLGSLLEAGARDPNLADLILFGHTHHYMEKTMTVDGRQVLILNPGSARSDSFGQPASAALLRFDPDHVNCEGLLDRT